MTNLLLRFGSGLYDPLFTPAVAKHNIGVFLARQPKFTGKITLRVFRGGHTAGSPTELEDSIKWCGWLQACMRSFTEDHGLSIIMYDGLIPATQVVWHQGRRQYQVLIVRRLSSKIQQAVLQVALGLRHMGVRF